MRYSIPPLTNQPCTQLSFFSTMYFVLSLPLPVTITCRFVFLSFLLLYRHMVCCQTVLLLYDDTWSALISIQRHYFWWELSSIVSLIQLADDVEASICINFFIWKISISDKNKHKCIISYIKQEMSLDFSNNT